MRLSSGSDRKNRKHNNINGLQVVKHLHTTYINLATKHSPQYAYIQPYILSQLLLCVSICACERNERLNDEKEDEKEKKTQRAVPN